MRHFTQTDAAQAKAAEDGSRAPANITARVGPHGELRLTLTFFNQSLFCQKETPS